MKIAVVSGKGGTGKTTIASNLARTMKINYIDCDVEEPNGHIFLKPSIDETLAVTIANPVFDTQRCVACQKCVNVCQFNALAMVLNKVVLFHELCHGCGACVSVCPQGAIGEEGRVMGQITRGTSPWGGFLSGKINIHEPMGGPVISRLKDLSQSMGACLYDASPGTSCSVVKTLDKVDYGILVTEPSQFGLHDLKLAVALVREMKIPFGLVLNRKVEGETMIESYCQAENIGILASIPFSRKAAEMYARGQMLTDDPYYKKIFEDLARTVEEKIQEVKTCN